MEERKMKIDPTKTLVHVLYTYNGTQDGMYCFTLVDDWALVLELPWTDYTVEFSHRPAAPATGGRYGERRLCQDTSGEPTTIAQAYGMVRDLIGYWLLAIGRSPVDQ